MKNFIAVLILSSSLTAVAGIDDVKCIGIEISKDDANHSTIKKYPLIKDADYNNTKATYKIQSEDFTFTAFIDGDSFTPVIESNSESIVLQATSSPLLPLVSGLPHSSSQVKLMTENGKKTIQLGCGTK